MILKKFCCLAFVLIQFTVNAQELRITKGVVVDSIPVNDTIQESFSLYLPQTFENDRAWPVIVVFEPGGEGRKAAQMFMSIAEEQGYIIAASNQNLEKDSLTENISKGTRLLNSLYSLLPISQDMIYTAGLAEGAQVASALPVIFKIRGVLAIGDIWINADFINNNNKFMFSAVVGDKDSKVYDVKNVIDFLKKSGFETELNYFDGGKEEWPGVRVLSNAVTGFTIEAISKGIREEDETFVRELYENEVEYTEVLRRKREYFQSFEKLQAMKDKYSPFDFKGDLRERIRELRRNKAFRQQRRQYRRAATQETEMLGDYTYFMESDIASANFDNLGWWEYQLQELERLKEGDNPAEAKMAYRLEGFLDDFSEKKYTDIQLAEETIGIDIKIFTSVLRTVFDKNDPEAYLNIVELAGKDGDYYTALLYLEDLLKTGFDDMDALYGIEGILDFTLSRQYNDLIKKYLGESRYYNY